MSWSHLAALGCSSGSLANVRAIGGIGVWLCLPLFYNWLRLRLGWLWDSGVAYTGGKNTERYGSGFLRALRSVYRLKVSCRSWFTACPSLSISGSDTRAISLLGGRPRILLEDGFDLFGAFDDIDQDIETRVASVILGIDHFLHIVALSTLATFKLSIIIFQLCRSLAY